MLDHPFREALPSAYVFEHIKMTSQPMEEPANPHHFMAMLEMILAEKRRSVFSSDLIW